MAGLRTEFQQIPVDVFDALDDVVVDGILRQHSSTYIAGGGVTSVDTDYPTRLVEDTLTDAELAAGIAVTGDRKFLLPATELPVTPKAKDSIVYKGVWNIYQSEIDPAGALWTIYARQ